MCLSTLSLISLCLLISWSIVLLLNQLNCYASCISFGLVQFGADVRAEVCLWVLLGRMPQDSILTPLIFYIYMETLDEVI